MDIHYIYWLKELQEGMDRCTGRRNITEILLKTALNTIQSINQYYGYIVHSVIDDQKYLTELGELMIVEPLRRTFINSHDRVQYFYVLVYVNITYVRI